MCLIDRSQSSSASDEVSLLCSTKLQALRAWLASYLG